MRVVTPLTGRLDAEGFYARVQLDDGTEVALVPLFGGRARVTLGPSSDWMVWEHGF